MTPAERRLISMVDPLTVIRTAARNASEELAAGDVVAVSREVAAIRRAAATLNQMLNKTIESTRTEARR